MKRRTFIQNTALASTGIATGAAVLSCKDEGDGKEISAKAEKKAFIKPSPIAVCTWGFSDATQRAGELLDQGIPALDAVIAGVAIEEENLDNTTVGIGATPDREGKVSLDACVMNSDGNCGAVLAVQNIVNVAALARKVMEETPHVILTGEGAEEFAYTQGFTKTNLLTADREAEWKKWLKTSDYSPEINIENHDTIGMLAIDSEGNIAGACTTSGLGYKMKGRVGDSAIIGSGLFIDNEVGGAVATGMGEEVLKTVGSFLIVELMRNGKTPQEACEEAIKRITSKNPNYKNFQIAYVAIHKSGAIGSYSIHEDFSIMKYQNGKNVNLKTNFFNKAK